MKIYTLGEEVLRKKSILIPSIDKNISDLAEAMLTTMYEGKGIGLAAPQVGENIRMFVCHVDGDQPRVFINPELIATSPEQILYEEGCLSIPGIYSDVQRPQEITVQAWNTRGSPYTLSAGGILARVIQHEIDHLNGILFLDHLDEKKRNRLAKLFEKQVAV